MVRSPSNPAESTALHVEIWPSLANELLMTIGAHQHPLNWDSLEAGKAGFDEINRRMSPELKGLLEGLALTGAASAVWESLTGWLYTRRIGDPEAAAAAIAGADADAVSAWLGALPGRPQTPLATLPERLATSIRFWRRDLMGDREAQLAAGLESDAAAKRLLAEKVSPERLLELATNGLTWRPQAHVRRAVLIPSQIISPWVNHVFVHDAVLFSYPVGAAGLDASQRILRLARVLGDESRMAALRLLASRPLTLQELADELGLRKSTMHHHLAHLRAEGLLRVPFGTKTYELRREPLLELAAHLKDFGGAL